MKRHAGIQKNAATQPIRVKSEKRGAVIYSRFFLTRIHLADCSQMARFETFFFGHGIFISGQNCGIDQKNAIVGSRQGAAAPPQAVLREGRRGISAGEGVGWERLTFASQRPKRIRIRDPWGSLGKGWKVLHRRVPLAFWWPLCSRPARPDPAWAWFGWRPVAARQGVDSQAAVATSWGSRPRPDSDSNPCRKNR